MHSAVFVGITAVHLCGVSPWELKLSRLGRTGDPLRVYSGDTLMDLLHNQALKMTLKTLDGGDYLIVESGGFHEKHGPDWKNSLHVLKRK